MLLAGSVLARLFTVFMVAILTFSFGLVIYRLPLLRARKRARLVGFARGGIPRQQLDPLFCAFFVLFATMTSTLSEAVVGRRLTVAAPFYNRWMAPVGLILLSNRRRAAAYLAEVKPFELAPAIQCGPCCRL